MSIWEELSDKGTRQKPHCYSARYFCLQLGFVNNLEHTELKYIYSALK